jgi:hypothetical protein
MEKGGKPDRKPYTLPYSLRNPRKLKSENSQDYAQKPQRNSTFMNSASGLSKDVTALVRECAVCQRWKIHAIFRSPLSRFPSRNTVLPTSTSTLWAPSHRHSHWMEALPLAYTAAAEVVTALFSGWICRFGVPAFIT